MNRPAAGTPGPHAGQRLPLIALGAWLALLMLCVAWEMWLAPLRPGGSALVLKALPLLLPVRGLLRRSLYTMQWSAMLVLCYFAEGIVRGMSDLAPSNLLGWLEAALAVVYFVCAIVYVAPYKRAAKQARNAKPATVERP
jgi:uncharacterized membrane protein